MRSRADVVLRTVLAAVLVALPVLACGPDFPDRFLLGRKELLKKVPEGRFAREIDELSRRPAGPTRNDLTRIAADLADFDASMGARATPELRAKYEAARGEGPTHGPLPKELTRELALYGRGARHHRESSRGEAAAAWRELLALPPDERRNKSTWAAYMLGRIATGPEAVRRYREVRALAAAGFADRHGLARESLGWEAREELIEGHTARAVELYLEADAAGDPMAAPSLREVAERLVARPADQRAAAYDTGRVLEVMAIFFASRSDEELEGTGPVKKALDHAVAHVTSAKGEVPAAAHLAWAVYRRGRIDDARALLDHAPRSPLSSYMRSKLLLRQGKLADAGKLLVDAVEQLPPSDDEVSSRTLDLRSRARGELGILKLSRGELPQAARLFLRAGSWRDAAYVVERVMTTKEAVAFVQAEAPQASKQPASGGTDTTRELRWLLARRLVREGRLGEAMPLLPDEHAGSLAALRDARRRAADASATDAVRAEALFDAARIERHRGMELMGTEVGPDWHLDDGQFDEGAEEPGVEKRERARRAASRPFVEKRFHYRYVAARDVLRAVDLAPRPRAALMLCVARRWFSRDPAEQKRLANELLRRKLPTACDGAEDEDVLPAHLVAAGAP